LDKKNQANLNLSTTPTKNRWESFRIVLKQEINFEEISSLLIKYGYENIGRSQVVEEGQFSFRGGLLDLWLERYKIPVRIDLIGSKIEGIYLFNPLTNEKIKNIKELIIIPFRSLPNLEKIWRKRGEKNYKKIFLSELKEGDYVVHIDNGIGKFVGYSRKNVGGVEAENLVIEYARGDKLFVPVNQVERLTKYVGVGKKKPLLTTLGTQSWEKIKQKVKDSVINTAKELLDIYAKRELIKRKPYPADSSWQKILEGNFEFRETEDQLKAIGDIKKDLESNKPMDRLLVGDVGFGKTEVALRAAFKVAQGEKQVAFLVPTTILAEQHFHLFKHRLKDFPIRVEILSRLTNKNQQKNIIKDVEKGRVDILIGTHAILSKKVKFANLGLLIIDEEHRFGVNQKEKLKKERLEVDVLSLSATPIPRSLQLSLAKIRDISFLTNAPFGRLPIETFVFEYDLDQIKQALEKELARKGKAFYLSNRIVSLHSIAAKIADLLPKAKVAFAHGQMSNSSLEKVMNQFYQDEIDILVCTTIIGSGLDVPNVNTIIIEDAHQLGLADLYQLKGRVGRGENKAYAYLFYPKGYKPTGKAAQRLLAIKEAVELGSGFRIASQDLEIRGAGNLLGTEQSGNISLVGFELYLQLLSQAVEQLRVS